MTKQSFFSRIFNVSSTNSLPEVYQSVRGSMNSGLFRRFFLFLGPGFLVSVGYIDPGNWSTDLEGGSRFGYQLLWVILLASLMAILLQSLAVRLGVGKSQDLAQACARKYRLPTRIVLWILAEIAIIATDLAEILGSAIAMFLLFDIPIIYGVLITILDVLVLLLIQRFGFRLLEALILSFLLINTACFGLELFYSQPDFVDVAKGFIPSTEIFSNTSMLYISVGILGATVMPHNLYLHSSIVQTRYFKHTEKDRKIALRFASIDSAFSLSLAFFINAAILILAASTFYVRGLNEVAEIQDAYQLLSPLLGVPAASLLFGIALLASGQASTITGTLTGQIVMEGFVQIRLQPWQRRLITRLLATIPVFITLFLWGEQQINSLIILSQVLLSMQLPFAVIPLVQMTSDKKFMGQLVNPLWLKALAWLVALLIVFLNLALLGLVFFGE